jgi:uncharacterized protein (DUF2141 family)
MSLKISQLPHLLLATLLSISCARAVNAEQTANLTVVVNGIEHKTGEICMRIYSSAKGFPMSSTGGVQSGCTRITGTTVAKEFHGLKPGTYAVAVLDDQKGDHKLHRNFFGIPTEGFGISDNPTVSVMTGMPKFQDASFFVVKDTTIKISMKYSLDQ